jgi:pimeloyl-ACP methyl ester carboxylesterase
MDRSHRNRRRPGLIKPLMTVRENLPLWESGFATRIGEITHPTLVLWGQEDRVFPVTVGNEIHQTIKGSRFISIPKAGHIPQWERPDLVNQELITFIRP